MAPNQPGWHLMNTNSQLNTNLPKIRIDSGEKREYYLISPPHSESRSAAVSNSESNLISYKTLKNHLK